MPEQELLSMVPGQPPLSRWTAQMEISGSRWDRVGGRIRRRSQHAPHRPQHPHRARAFPAT